MPGNQPDYTRLLQPRPAWFDLAACRGLTALFYTDIGEPTSQAKSICAECPARHLCAQAGRHEHFGVWGGLTEKDRRTIRRKVAA